MVKNRFFALGFSVLAVILVFSLISVSAGHLVGENENYSISKTNYGPGDNIEGWINISFEDEPVDSLFSDNNENNATLYDLLKGSSGLNSDYDDYSCDFPECEEHYATTGTGSLEKSTTLNTEKSAIFGISLEGNIDSIESASFNLNSNASASCSNQIEIDMFADDDLDAINTNNGSEICNPLGYGCFDSSVSTTEYSIKQNSNIFCQEINITRSPSVEAGAWIKNVSGSMELKMYLYDLNENRIGECSLPQPSNQGGEIGCSVRGTSNSIFLEKEKPYYVCVVGTGGIDAGDEYKIKGYASADEEKCGAPASPSFDSVAAYQIFAREKEFGDVEDFKIQGDNLAQNAEDYLVSEYGDMDCSSHECIIPVKIKSNINNQKITMSDLSVELQTNAGATEMNNIYKLEKVPAEITSEYGKFYFNDGNFTAPDEEGEFDFELSFGGEEIISEELNVVEVPHDIGLFPLETSTVISTDFRTSAEAAGNITEYSWDFGDNNTATTTKNTVSHTYESTGNYTVKVTVTDEFGRKGSNSFRVRVKTPEERIETMLESKKEDMEDFKSKTSSYDTFKKETIEEYLGISKKEQILDGIDANYTGNNSEEELNDLAKKLIDIKVPSNIEKTASGSGIMSFSNTETISPEIMGSITDEDYSWEDEEKYSTAIEEWETVNMGNKISYEEYTVQFNGDPESFNFYALSLGQKQGSSTDEYYFVMEKMEGLKFDDFNMSETSDGGHVYKKLTGDKTVSFFTTQDTSFDEIPYFASPKLSEVNINSTDDIEPEEPEDNMKWVWYILIVIGLAMVGLVVYYFLQRWYDKKYEDSLFKDKNKLYNLANYVTRAKKKGMSNSEIKKNLKKAKWSGEQIRYVMKKYAGKRTGLPKLFGNLFGGDKPKKPKNPQNTQGAQRTQRYQR